MNDPKVCTKQVVHVLICIDEMELTKIRHPITKLPRKAFQKHPILSIRTNAFFRNLSYIGLLP